MPNLIVFDVGGTKTRVALSRDGETLVGEPFIQPTPAKLVDGLELLTRMILELSSGETIAAIAGGLPGPVDRHHGRLVAAPNLPGWVGEPIREILERRLQSPVLLENDAALVGLGEAVFGAGRGERIVAYLTVSTGVGGVRVVEGRIDERSLSFEPGHQLIDPGRTLAPEAPGPYLQDLISGRAVETYVGRPPREINDQKFWDKIAYWLALGLNNTIVHWSPQVVVLGGSMFHEPGIKIADTERYLKAVLRIFDEPPPLKPAQLGDFGGLYGGLALLRTGR